MTEVITLLFQALLDRQKTLRLCLTFVDDFAESRIQ